MILNTKQHVMYLPTPYFLCTSWHGVATRSVSPDCLGCAGEQDILITRRNHKRRRRSFIVHDYEKTFSKFKLYHENKYLQRYVFKTTP